MCDVTNDALNEYRAEAEAQDEPLTEPDRPGVGDSTIVSVRLTEEEHTALTMYSDVVQVPVSSLVRGWVVQRLQESADSSTDAAE